MRPGALRLWTIVRCYGRRGGLLLPSFLAARCLRTVVRALLSCSLKSSGNLQRIVTGLWLEKKNKLRNIDRAIDQILCVHGASIAGEAVGAARARA
jgi:hypothetical protein